MKLSEIKIGSAFLVRASTLEWSVDAERPWHLVAQVDYGNGKGREFRIITHEDSLGEKPTFYVLDANVTRNGKPFGGSSIKRTFSTVLEAKNAAEKIARSKK